VDIIANIKKRKSWRSYKKETLSIELIQAIKEQLTGESEGPLEKPVNVHFFAKDKAENRKLGTYGMVKNARYFLGGEIVPQKESFLDFGYIMERAVLILTDMDLGTCWLGGTFTKSNFMEAADIDETKIMPAVIATGYPKEKRALRDKLIAFNAGSSKRKPWDELFFETNSVTPLDREEMGAYNKVLDMVRLAPSASNLQPWRIVKQADNFHFYLKRKMLYKKAIKNVDLQMIDMGIAMYHFAATAEQLELNGSWQIDEYDLDKKWEYIISWKVN